MGGLWEAGKGCEEGGGGARQKVLAAEGFEGQV